ncbi:MAG: AtpZ/AtpI family protein [Alphaproteobacteria bacterium]|nr:AtpZ/AtpI family protein [Alphaproteobacteria bacterium]
MRNNNYFIKSMNCGLEFFSCVAIGVFFGVWLDKKVGTSPLFLVIFLFLGSIAGYLNIKRYIQNENEKSK